MGVVFVADAAPQCNRDTLSLVLYVKAFQCISPALLKSLAFAMHRKNLASERSLGALQGLVLARAELQANLVHCAGLLYGQVQLQVRP